MTHFSKTAHTTTISNELFEELFWRYTNWLEELSMHCVEDGFSADDLENIAELAGEIADAIAPCYTVNDHIPKSLRTCAEDLRNGAAELRDLEEESEELEEESEEQWVNHYECECGHFWTDVWSCRCNDKCIKCGAEIEPSYSLEAVSA